MAIVTELADTEVLRRFHRDLLNNPAESTSELEQLARASGKTSSTRFDAFGPEKSLDEVLHALKVQRQQINSWKSDRLRQLPTNVAAYHQESQLSKQHKSHYNGDENAASEIAHLKALLKRYQEADPSADFVHKDVLAKVNEELLIAKQAKASVLEERAKLLRDLESSKWMNSQLETERDLAKNEVGKAKDELTKLNKTILEREAECDKHRQVELTLEKQLREFQRRYEALDNHLMELGEQKTAFLEGIRERQSQLDYVMAQLQASQESLVRSDRENDLYRRRLEEAEARVTQLTAQLKDAQTEGQRLRDQLKQTNSRLEKTEQLLLQTENKNKSLRETMTHMEQKSNNQQALLEKLGAALISTTDKFEAFVKEIEKKETSWSVVTQKAWDELQLLKNKTGTMLSETSFSKSEGNQSVSNMAGHDHLNISHDYENLVAKAKAREAELVSPIRAQVSSIRNKKNGIMTEPHFNTIMNDPVHQKNNHNIKDEQLSSRNNVHSVPETINQNRKVVGLQSNQNTQQKTISDMSKKKSLMETNQNVISEEQNRTSLHMFNKVESLKACPPIPRDVSHFLNLCHAVQSRTSFDGEYQHPIWKAVIQNESMLGQMESKNSELSSKLSTVLPDYMHTCLESHRLLDIPKKAVDTALNEIGKLKTDGLQKQREAKELSEINKTNEMTIKQLKDTIDKLTKEVTAMNNLNKELEGKNSLLQKDKEALEQRLKELEKLLKEKEDLIRNLENDLKDSIRNHKRAQIGKKIAEHQVGQRRGSIGWEPQEKPTQQIEGLKRGFTVTKLAYNAKTPFKNKHKPQSRFIKLSHDGTHLQLWTEVNKDKQKAKPDKTIPLSTILRTEYGPTSTAKAWQNSRQMPPSVPWKCFSLYTPDRSYNYICNDDNQTEMLVLGVGNGLTNGAIGIKSRQELIFRRAKMKLSEHCKRRGITMKQLLLEAIRRCVVTTPGLARELGDAKAALTAKKSMLQNKISSIKASSQSDKKKMGQKSDGLKTKQIEKGSKKLGSLEPSGKQIQKKISGSLEKSQLNSKTHISSTNETDSLNQNTVPTPIMKKQATLGVTKKAIIQAESKKLMDNKAQQSGSKLKSDVSSMKRMRTDIMKDNTNVKKESKKSTLSKKSSINTQSSKGLKSDTSMKKKLFSKSSSVNKTGSKKSQLKYSIPKKKLS